MKDFISDLIEIGISTNVDMSNHEVVMGDTVYRMEMGKAYDLQEKLMDILTDEQQELFEEYMDAVSVANNRVGNLTYLLGLKRMMELSGQTTKDKI